MAIEVKIVGDSSGIVSDINKTEKSVLALNQGFQLASGVATLAFNAFSKVADVVGDVLSIGIQFEQSMADLRATIGGLTANEFEKLNKQAEKLGSTTRFSATEAANAMQELARAGFDVNEILETTGAVLNTASAAGTDLAFAANIVAGAFKNFERTGISANEISDLLAKTANSSRQTFEQLAGAVDRSGAVASQFGINFSELTQIFGAVADAGFRGELAATALNGALVRLGKETPEMKKVLDQLGLSFSDIDTSTNSFRDILDNVSKSGANAQQIIQLLGQEAGPKLVKLFSEGSVALDNFRTKQEAANSASESAAIRNDTLSGKIKELNSAYQGLAIIISQSSNQASSDFVEFATKTIKFIGELIKDFNKLRRETTLWAQEIRDGIDDFIKRLFKTKDIVKNIEATKINLQLDKQNRSLGKAQSTWGKIWDTIKRDLTPSLNRVDEELKSINKELDGTARKNEEIAFQAEKRAAAQRELLKRTVTEQEFIDAINDSLREQQRELDRIAAIERTSEERRKKAIAGMTTQFKELGKTQLDIDAQRSRNLEKFAKSQGAQVAGQVVGVSGAIQGFQAGGPAGAGIGALTEILLSNKILNEQIGRLNEAIITLLDPIITALIPLFDATINILDELRPLFVMIGEQLALIVEDLQPILEELLPIIAALVDAMRPLIPLFRRIHPALVALSRVSKFLASVMSRLAGAISGLDGTMRAVATAVQGLQNAIENFSPGGLGGGGGGGFLGFAQGGLVTKDRMTRLPGMEQDAGLIMAHEGERVVNNNDSSSSGNVFNINISAGMGSDGRSIANMLREELEKLSLTGRLQVT